MLHNIHSLFIQNQVLFQIDDDLKFQSRNLTESVISFQRYFWNKSKNIMFLMPPRGQNHVKRLIGM